MFANVCERFVFQNKLLFLNIFIKSHVVIILTVYIIKQHACVYFYSIHYKAARVRVFLSHFNNQQYHDGVSILFCCREL